MVETNYDTRVSAYAIIAQEAEILLASWNRGVEPLWTLPGGGINLHESPDQALVREVREETGYDIEVDQLHVAVLDVIGADKRVRAVPLRRVRLIYTARVRSGSLTFEKNGSTSEAQWIPFPLVAKLPRTSIVDSALETAMRLA
jgi:8-oxo-dGTP diphosphatase